MDEKNSATTKTKPKITNFDKWIIGILNLEYFYKAYLINKNELKKYNKKVSEYKTSFITMFILLSITYSCIIADIVMKDISSSLLMHMMIVNIITFFMIKASSIWKRSITNETGSFKNERFEYMKDVDELIIFKKINMREVLEKLFAMTILIMLYPDKLKGISRTKEFSIVKKSLTPEDATKNYKQALGENHDSVKEAYIYPRISSSLLLTLIKNPNMRSVAEKYYECQDLKYVDDEVYAFFKYCNDTDDIECICEQKTFDEYSNVVAGHLYYSTFCNNALLSIISINGGPKEEVFPDFGNRLKKFASKKNSPFASLYENYQVAIGNYIEKHNKGAENEK